VLGVFELSFTRVAASCLSVAQAVECGEGCVLFAVLNAGASNAYITSVRVSSGINTIWEV